MTSHPEVGAVRLSEDRSSRTAQCVPMVALRNNLVGFTPRSFLLDLHDASFEDGPFLEHAVPRNQREFCGVMGWEMKFEPAQFGATA